MEKIIKWLEEQARRCNSYVRDREEKLVMLEGEVRRLRGEIDEFNKEEEGYWMARKRLSE